MKYSAAKIFIDLNLTRPVRRCVPAHSLRAAHVSGRHQPTDPDQRLIPVKDRGPRTP